MSSNPFEPAPSPELPRKRGFTWVELLVVIAIIGILIGLLLPFRRTAGEAAKRMQCSNNFKELALAMHAYHDFYKSLPPAYTVDAQGNRLHSWRTLLLPFLEQRALYEKIDLSKPWNDPINVQAIGELVPPVYICPSSKIRKTVYQVIVDPESAFPGAETVSLQQITDGTSNTFLIVETPSERAVEWMSPHDTDLSALLSVNEKSKLLHTGIFQVACADGSVIVIPAETKAEMRRSLTTIAAGDPLDYDELP